MEFLKKLFSRKEPESISIPLGEVQELLLSHERAAKDTLLSSAAEPIRNIRNGTAQLQLIVNTIAGAEHDPAIHPKLKSIAKNTLPQYIRAMNTALGKELPDSPEDFYPAAVECVKNCLRAIQGPGRYLQIVFPEEMKASRTGIDAIGRELNSLTATLATYRNAMTAITQARLILAEITDGRSDLLKADEKRHRSDLRIREMEARLSGIVKEELAIQSDPQKTELDAQRAEIAALEHQREEMTRTYAALSMTAAHVLRKAEKIAARQKHADDVTRLKHAMVILSDHDLPDPVELENSLTGACPVAERMIEQGEIAIKNKEERAVFSDLSLFYTTIRRTCTELRAHEETCRSAQEALLAHPLLVKQGSLEREKGQLTAMLEKERNSARDLEHWQQKMLEHIPVLTEDLRKKLEPLTGKTVRIDDSKPDPS